MSWRMISDGFTGVAVTRAGRVLFGSTGELRQTPAPCHSLAAEA